MLNDFYQNIDLEGFFNRYGFKYGIYRAFFIKNPVHYSKEYEVNKFLWQKQALKKIKKYLKYKNLNPKDIKFSEKKFDNPMWIYWDKGIENSPKIVQKCFESLKKYYGENVILLTEQNIKEYIIMPKYIEEKKKKGFIPIAGYTDLIRFSLLEHYGGTWIDATVYFTDRIPNEIINCEFFAFQNSMGLLDNPVLFPAWFLHAEKHSKTITEIRNVTFAYWLKEKHVIEYLLPNLIITSLVSKEEYQKIPYMSSDYSEYLVKILGEEYTKEKIEWVKKLTSIHKLTYKLNESINQESTVYYKLITSEFD